MAIVLVANTSVGSPNGGTVTTPAINTTGANLIVVGIAENKTSAHGAVTDSKGNTLTGLTTYEDSTRRVKQYYLASPTVGSGHTVTYTLSAGNTFPAVFFSAYSGVAATPFDQEQGSVQASGATIQPGTRTPSVNNCLIVTTLFRSTDTGGVSIDGGFTLSDSVNFVGGQCLAGAFAYLIQTTAAASNPTWSGIDAGVGSATTQAIFKPTVSAAIALGAKGSGINTAVAASVTATITGTPTLGSTWVVGIISRSSTQTVTGFTDNSTGGPMTFIQIASWINGATNSRTSLWRTAVGGGKANVTTITAAMSPTERDVVICATEWLNVVDIGGNNSGSSTDANPTIALTTQDANNYVVAMFGARGATVPTSLTGTLQLGLSSDGGSPVSGGMVSNTAASASSVTCAETLVASTWMALAVELRTVAAGGGGGSSGKIASALMRQRGA